MRRDQVDEIVLEIRLIYPQVTKETSFEEMGDLYERYLLNKDFDLVWSNLVKHVETSTYPPKIADLVKKQEEPYPIPNVQETKEYLEKLENKKPLNEDELAKWHKKLFEAIGVKQ